MNLNIESHNEVTENSEQTDPMIVLEEALTLCKFGKFHLRLLFASFCAIMAAISVVTTSSFILPIAECDLKMDMMLKGWLNSMPFVGQIGVSLFVGFLVDTFGRRIFLITGNLGIFITALLEGTSQTYWMLVIVKMLQGIAMSITYAAISTMLSEFIQKELRDRILLIFGGFTSISIIVLSLMSWAILPQTQLNISLWNGYFEIHSWNIYLYVCSIWSFIAFIMYYTLPESPKFLLSDGHNDKALDVLKYIYHENTGKPIDTFPIKHLKCGIPNKLDRDKKFNFKKQIVNSLFEVKHLVDKVVVYRLILMCGMTFVYLSTYSCLRLWYPQISTTVEHYYNDHGHSSRFCEMINYKNNQSISNADVTHPDICEPQVSGSETYINSMLLGLTGLVFVGVASVLVHWVGHRLLIFVVQLSSAACASSLYYTNSSTQIAFLISFICAFMQANGSLQSNILVRIFPTKLRALTFSIVMIVGRLGSLLGNILFPILLDMGCMAPFLTLSVASLCQASVVFFLPDLNKENKTGDK
ncbi:synaptic vesicle glycoprotein 2B-like isoform X1 [Pieris napi]|uniref:synaptic vesicle glycoprotein 2B-like isoform X1 n=1 Tax=Pieris napi TaxID=78633 RepID=UPI001FB9198E|nr:synaptic vesicle glycoprotein 2B-like isoform X1 [Pieris napi]